MMKKVEYVNPQIKVCDYLSRNGYCIEGDPDIETSDQLGKEATVEEEPEADSQELYKRSVWDD